MIVSLSRTIDHMEELLRQTRARLRVSPDDDALIAMSERLVQRLDIATRERRRLADAYLD
jgi:hypothetical protein